MEPLLYEQVPTDVGAFSGLYHRKMKEYQRARCDPRHRQIDLIMYRICRGDKNILGWVIPSVGSSYLTCVTIILRIFPDICPPKFGPMFYGSLCSPAHCATSSVQYVLPSLLSATTTLCMQTAAEQQQQ